MYCHQCGTSGCIHAQMGMAGMGGISSMQQQQSAYYDALRGIADVQSRVIAHEQEQEKQKKKNKKLLLLRK